jgi:hypothetical protein
MFQREEQHGEKRNVSCGTSPVCYINLSLSFQKRWFHHKMDKRNREETKTYNETEQNQTYIC